MSPAELELFLFRQGSDPNGPTYGLNLRFRAPGSSAEVLHSAAQPVRFDLDALRARKTGDFSAYGQSLASQLLAEPGARSAFDQYRGIAASHAAPLHLRLFLDPSALELHNLLWETLRLPGETVPLLAGDTIRFSRFLSARDPAPVRTPSAADVRGLVVVAAPTNLDRLRPPLAPVDVVRELQTAHDGLGDIPADDLAAPGQANLAAIAARLRDGYDILYLVAHGVLRTDGEPALCLEKADGEADWVLGQELVNAIAGLSPDLRPGLVVLVSCQSAGVDGEWVAAGEAALAGLGPRLAAEAGVPAVTAMQGNLTMTTARDFMRELFVRLREDGQVERAVAVARTTVAKRPDWWMPVLFTRLRDGRVWQPASADARARIERKSFEPETIFIPAGSFVMGSPPGEGIPPEETPAHDVTLAGYRIGKYPVTNREYAAFLKDRSGQPAPQGWFNRQPPPDRLDHPVTAVSWSDALAYCAWLSDQTGRRYTLPSEAEWEKACSNDLSRSGPRETTQVVTPNKYPWGATWEEGRCNAGGSGASPVTAHPTGASAYGVEDLLGNVQQWTRSLWGVQPMQPDFSYPYRPEDGREVQDPDKLPAGMRLAHRGGSYKSSWARLRVTTRGSAPPDSRLEHRGFRVVMAIDGK